jgi:hypothetical protein
MPYTPSTEPIPVNPGGNAVTETEFLTIYDRPIAERTALMARHAHNVPFATWLKAMGNGKGSDTPTTGHYELGWEVATVTVNAITTAAGGAGNPLTFTLTAGDMYDSGVTSSGTSIQASYPVKNDVLELHDRTQVIVTAKDKTVNPHRITVKPLDSSIDLDSKITAAEEYAVLHNLHPEGSGLPAPRAPRVMKYTNDFGLIKHSFTITGHELSNSVYHETIPGDPSSARQSSFMLLEQSDIMRYERSKGYLLLLGQTTTGLTELVSHTNLDSAIEGTEGLVQFGLTYGFTDTYTAGSYAVTDFDAISTRLQDQRAISTAEVLTFDGPDITTETENVLNTFFANDLTPFVNNLINGYSDSLNGYQETFRGQNTVGLGYSVIKKNGMVFHMKKLDEFGDYKGGGHADYNYRKYRVTVPIGFSTDIRTRTKRAMVGYEFKQQGSYSREDVWGDFAGAGVGGNNSPYGKAVNEYDSYTRYMISHIAGHYACGNAIVMQIPA